MGSLRVIDEILQLAVEVKRVVEEIGSQDPELREQLRRAWTRVASGAAEASVRRGQKSRDSFDDATRESKEARVQLRYARVCGYAQVPDELLRRVDGVAAVLYTLAHKPGR